MRGPVLIVLGLCIFGVGLLLQLWALGKLG